MKVTRKRLLVAFVVAVAVSGGAWFFLAESSQPPFGVTRSAFDAIDLGMTIDEVERIIGYWDHSDTDAGSGCWFGEKEQYSVIVVSRDKDGLVRNKQFAHQSIYDRLWLKAYFWWGKLGF